MLQNVSDVGVGRGKKEAKVQNLLLMLQNNLLLYVSEAHGIERMMLFLNTSAN